MDIVRGILQKRLLSIAGLVNLLSPLKLFKTPRLNGVLPAFLQDCDQLLALVYVLDILVHLLLEAYCDLEAYCGHLYSESREVPMRLNVL